MTGFIRHCQSDDLQQFGEGFIKTFLTNLTVDGNVTAGTQHQAKYALWFLYQKVPGRKVSFLDVSRASGPERLPVILSRYAITRLLPEFNDLPRLMFLVMNKPGIAVNSPADAISTSAY